MQLNSFSRLEQYSTGNSFRTYIINVQKHAQDTSVLSFLLHWLKLFPEYEQRTLYGALVVTLAKLLRLLNCHFIIIIIIIIIHNNIENAC